jgi:predicted ATPase
MTNQALPSLEIQNFRAFQRLTIPHLARVNLIVGKNNVGKTSLLEALWLYANRGAWSALWDVIEWRDEGARPTTNTLTTPEVVDAQTRALAQLFYGRRDLASWPEAIRIGSTANAEDAVAISVAWRKEQRATTAQKGEQSRVISGLTVRRGGAVEVEYTFDLRSTKFRDGTETIAVRFVDSDGLQKAEMAKLWDAITLTDREDDVVRALQIVAPGVLRVNVLAEQERAVIVRLRDASQQVRLRSLGEGMNRMFGIILALVNAAGGMLLIDEVENGLHYSVLPETWRLIFEVATRLNVQVFATTHSKDCVEAFQRVARAHPEEGQVVRLGRKGENVVATLFDEEELETAVEQHVEVR